MTDRSLRTAWRALLAAALLTAIPACARPPETAAILLENDNLKIVFSDQEPGALGIALEAFRKDFVDVIIIPLFILYHISIHELALQAMKTSPDPYMKF